MQLLRKKEKLTEARIVSLSSTFFSLSFTEDLCRSSQDKKMCTKLQSVNQQLKDLQQKHQQTMADMRLLVTSMARLQKKVKLLESVSGFFRARKTFGVCLRMPPCACIDGPFRPHFARAQANGSRSFQTDWQHLAPFKTFGAIAVDNLRSYH